MNPKDPRSAYRIQRIQDLLAAGDHDQWQLAAKLFMSHRNVREYMPYLLETNLAHIVDWHQNNGAGPYFPTLRAGRGISKPRPSAIPMHERKKAARARVQADPERRERLNAVRRHQRRVRLMRAKPQTWLSALGVVA